MNTTSTMICESADTVAKAVFKQDKGENKSGQNNKEIGDSVDIREAEKILF